MPYWLDGCSCWPPGQVFWPLMENLAPSNRSPLAQGGAGWVVMSIFLGDLALILPSLACALIYKAPISGDRRLDRGMRPSRNLNELQRALRFAGHFERLRDIPMTRGAGLRRRDGTRYARGSRRARRSSFLPRRWWLLSGLDNELLFILGDLNLFF